MLKTRILLSLILAVPLLVSIFLLPNHFWEILVVAALALTGWELLRIAGLNMSHPSSVVITMIMLLLLMSGTLLLPVNTQWSIIRIACLLWVGTFFWLATINFAQTPKKRNTAFKVVISILFVLPAMLVFSRLQAISPWLVLALLTLVWVTDTFAYFVGRKVGGPKLAVSISPNKTIAGLFGGIAGAIIVAMVWIVGTHQSLWLLFAAIGLALVSVAGDLLASLLKRHAGRKDSSRLLPGHGGLLDRLDSVLPTAPFFAVVVHYWVLPLSA